MTGAATDRHESIVDPLKSMARGFNGSIMIVDPAGKIMVDQNGIVMFLLENTAMADPVAGPAEMERFGKMAAWVERRPDFDPEEIYVLTVSDWPERADDVAQWCADEFGEVEHYALTPAQIDGEFRGPPSFTPIRDGNMRFAALIGLHDRDRTRRKVEA